MKKNIILLLFLLLSFSMEAGSQYKVVYDFTKPRTLIPALPEHSHGSFGQTVLNGTTFKAGDINLTFHSNSKHEDLGTGLNSLVVYRSGQFTIEGNTELIEEVRFWGRNNGGIINYDKYVGSFGHEPYYDCWKSNGQLVNSVLFDNSGRTSQLDSIIVYYSHNNTILDVSSSSLYDGQELEEFKDFTINFSKPIKIDHKRKIAILKDGIEYTTQFLKTVNGNTLTLSTDPAITDNGDYLLRIPSFAVLDLSNECGNLEYTVNFKIKNTKQETPTNPEEEIDPDEMVAGSSFTNHADSLLSLQGVGYPSTTSDVFIAIQNLRSNGLSLVKDYKAAFDAYYKSIDIVMPTSGKYYAISAVLANGDKQYLAYDGRTLSSTSDKALAYRFLYDNGLFNANNDKTFTSLVAATLNEKNGTSYESANTTVAIAKYMVDSLDPKKMLGLLTIQGYFDDEIALSYLSLMNGSVTSSGVLYAYDNENTPAFYMEEVGKPYIPFETEVVMNPSGGSLPTLDHITVSFPKMVKDVNCDKTLVSLVSGDKNFVPAEIQHKGNNEFEVIFRNIDKGQYKFVASKGAFISGNDTIQAFSGDYTVTEECKFSNGFPSGYCYVIGDNSPNRYYYYTREINDISFFDYAWLESGVYVDESVEVIMQSRWMQKVVARGHLAPTEVEYKYVTPDSVITLKYPGVKIVWDKEFKEGDLATDMGSDSEGYGYTVIVSGGSFGDKNFGSFLTDRNSVSKSDCKVNEYFYFFVDLYPEKPFYAEYKMTEAPGTVDNAEHLNIQFSLQNPVIYHAEFPVTLRNSEGAVLTAEVTKPSSIQNIFDIDFVNVDKGRYTLSIPKGAFTCETDTVQEITEVYDVTVGSLMSTDFALSTVYMLNGKFYTSNEIYTEDLDSIVFYSYDWTDSNFYVNNNSVVQLLSDENELAATGKIKKQTITALGQEYPGVTIEWEKSFVEGDIPTSTATSDFSTYKLVIPEGAFGDATFASYIETPNSTKRSDCHVNKEYSIAFNVYPVPPFEVEYALNSAPGQVESLESVMILFKDVQNVTYNASISITLTSETKSYSAVSVTPISPSNNSFSIEFMNVDKGEYTLILPMGAFVCGSDTIQQIEEKYSVSVGCQINEDFIDSLICSREEISTNILTKDLNDLTFYDLSWYDSYLYVNDGVEVTLVNPGNEVVLKGHLKKSYVNIEHSKKDATCPAVSVVWEKEILEGDLTTSLDGNGGCEYRLIIPSYTVGDIYYSNYLVTPDQIRRSDCHVNGKAEIKVMLFPEVPKITIEDINTSIAEYLDSDSVVSITDIVDLIERYLAQ